MKNVEQLKFIIELYAKRNGIEVREYDRVTERVNIGDIAFVSARMSDGSHITIWNDYGINRRYTTVFKVNGKRVKMPQ